MVNAGLDPQQSLLDCVCVCSCVCLFVCVGVSAYCAFKYHVLFGKKKE